jgi:hyaluronoglucosaminidase
VRVRGIIEGFYGEPWSHEERLDLIRFCAPHGLNTWVHAPKDDPYHRARWREPYPDDELARLGELVAEARRVGVDFAYAIAPGLDLCYSKESELETLLAKCEQVRSVGVRSFQLLWDDLEHTLNCPEDEALYGHEERPSAAAQAPFSNRVAQELDQDGPLVICPMGYAGTGDSPYRAILGPRLDPEIVCYWTGPEVVSWGITREALDLAVHRYRDHEILLWDNYPVNDFARGTFFLGPLLGRDPRIADGRCAGLIANAMVEAVPSKLALATVADWCNDPHGYEPISSYERALGEHGAEVREALVRLAGETRVEVERPADVAALVQALLLGVDAATGAALLEPFV